MKFAHYFQNISKLTFIYLICFSAYAVQVTEAVKQDTEEPVNFTLFDIDDKKRSLIEFRGGWVVVNFWATWCGPCIEEMPDLQSFHDHNKFNARVIGVNFEEIEIEPLRRFLSDYKINFPILRIGETPLVPFEPLIGVPSTFLISPEGILSQRFVGTVTEAQLNAAIQQLELQFAK